MCGCFRFVVLLILELLGIGRHWAFVTVETLHRLGWPCATACYSTAPQYSCCWWSKISWLWVASCGTLRQILNDSLKAVLPKENFVGYESLRRYRRIWSYACHHDNESHWVCLASFVIDLCFSGLKWMEPLAVPLFTVIFRPISNEQESNEIRI